MGRFSEKKVQTEATYVSKGNEHAAVVKALHVMLLPEENDAWFAQGLEIDYFACGASIEEAKANFLHGLARTVCEHLVMHGNLNKVLVPASKEEWDEYSKTPPDKIKKQALSFVTAVKVFEQAKEPAEKAKLFPYDGIQFYKGEPVAAAN
jgi:hypothetical protein